MPKPTLSFTADPAIRASFQAQLAEARETPGLSGLVTLPTPDLYPRYSGYYRQLCKLPRRVRRAVQRQWKRSLSALALLLALGQAPALAANINVNGTSCTLANAITAANTDVHFRGCTAGSGPDTLILKPGSTHTLTKGDNSIYGGTGLPTIQSEITIVGNGSTIERGAGAPKFRLLAVGYAGQATLQDLTLTGGHAPYYNQFGGGVVNVGTLVLNHCTVSNSNAGEFGRGGGVFSSRDLTVANSTVSGNSANSGGGVEASRTVVLIDSIVSGNSASTLGGGTYFLDSFVSLHNSTISGNHARSGGGIHAYSRHSGVTLNVLNTTMSGNTALVSGGGLEQLGGTLTFTNSTVSGNNAGYDAGGINSTATATLTNSTISNDEPWKVEDRGEEPAIAVL